MPLPGFSVEELWIQSPRFQAREVAEQCRHVAESRRRFRVGAAVLACNGRWSRSLGDSGLKHVSTHRPAGSRSDSSSGCHCC